MEERIAKEKKDAEAKEKKDPEEVKERCMIEMTKGREIPESTDQVTEGVEMTGQGRQTLTGQGRVALTGLERVDSGTEEKTGLEKELKGKKGLVKREMDTAEREKRAM